MERMKHGTLSSTSCSNTDFNTFLDLPANRMTDSARKPAPPSIRSVVGLERWLVQTNEGLHFALFGEPTVRYDGTREIYRSFRVDFDSEWGNELSIIATLSKKKVGEVGSYWNADERIEYKYAKIKLEDVFAYYTNDDGELRVPHWNSFKFAVDEYLENKQDHD